MLHSITYSNAETSYDSIRVETDPAAEGSVP